MAVQTPDGIVAPHVISPGTGETLLLSDVVRDLIESGLRQIELTGNGTATAMKWLVHELSDVRGKKVIDGPFVANQDGPRTRLLLLTDLPVSRPEIRLELAPWTMDDVIEFLLLNHRDQCQSVMKRLTADDDRWFADGDPGVWTVVARRMADNEEIASVSDAVLDYFHASVGDDKLAETIASNLFQKLGTKFNGAGFLSEIWPGRYQELARCFRNSNFQLIVACPAVVSRIRERKDAEWLFARQWPMRLLDRVADGIRGDGLATEWVNDIANRKKDYCSSMAASLMVRIDPGWRPASLRAQNLNYAMLSGVSWEGMKLSGSSLLSTDFSGADLRRVSLVRTVATESDFSRADCREALIVKGFFRRARFDQCNLDGARATAADFTKAEMSGVSLVNSRLQRVIFTGANLTNAVLDLAWLQKAEFTGAILEGASLVRANLHQAVFQNADLRRTRLDESICDSARFLAANMEGLQVSGISFIRPNFGQAVLTGSQWRGVNMERCDLQNARLADIEWEGCNLQGANFSSATFHMGSTRCGLVGSPFPSHGTRTGFYTDEFGEQYFKTPEEIRKASLRGCDLRGANVDWADFYLVDLRNAVYDSKQKEHFQKCGAILEVRE